MDPYPPMPSLSPPTKKVARVWGSVEQRIVAARQDWKCAACVMSLDAAFHLDHIRPLWKGGTNDIETNGQALCTRCHAHKTLLEERELLDKLHARREAAIVAARTAGAARHVSASERTKFTNPNFRDALLDKNPFLHCNRQWVI